MVNMNYGHMMNLKYFLIKQKIYKMEPYWTNMYKYNNEEHTVELYKYSQNHIALVSSHYFLNGFSKHFKKLAGVYNSDLQTINKSGFLFNINNQDTLINLLVKIFKKNIVIVENDNNETIQKCISLFDQLNTFILDNNNDTFTVTDNANKTTLSINDDSEQNDDYLIIKYQSSKGTVKLYQHTN